MSQAIQTEKSDITTRLERLDKLAKSIEKLENEKENIEEKRRKRKQKNEAFDEVREVISETESTFLTLGRAAELAGVLDTAIPQHEIEDTLDTYRPWLQEFTSKSYDDFEDIAEISSARKEAEAFRETLNAHQESIKSKLTATAESEINDVETLEAILRIPDIGTEDDVEAVDNYKQKLLSVKRGQIIDSDGLANAQREYSAVNIDIETIRSNYGLSEDGGDLLLRFLQNESVTLDDIDDGVLDELKALEEFSKRLTIQF